jgi:putative transposase
LTIAQRESRRRFKVKRNLARHAARTGSERRDFTHKLFRTLVNRYSHIALDNLNVTGLVCGMFTKSVLNAAGGQVILFTDDKAAEAG